MPARRYQNMDWIPNSACEARPRRLTTVVMIMMVIPMVVMVAVLGADAFVPAASGLDVLFIVFVF